MPWSTSPNELSTARLVSAASDLRRCAPTRKQARTPIDVTLSPPCTRHAKCQVRSGTSRNSPTITNCRCCCPQPSGAVTNSHRAVLPSFYRRSVWAKPQARPQSNPACLLAYRCTTPSTGHSRAHSIPTIKQDVTPNQHRLGLRRHVRGTGRMPESSHLPEQPSGNMKRPQNVNE